MDRKPLLASSESDEEEDNFQRHRQGISQAAKRNYSVSFNQAARLIRHGNLQKLKDILAKQDVKLTDSRGTSLLHVAAATNNPEAIETLMRHRRCRALIDAADVDGTTPAMVALQATNYGTLEQLCALGADLTKPMQKTGKTLLHLAAISSDITAAQNILRYNSTPEFVNAIDHSGDTPLIEAVHLQSPVFDQLLAAKADITVRNPENGRTVLHVAVAYNRDAMVEKIVHHASAVDEFAEITDEQGDSALMIAVKLQNADNVRSLIGTFSNLNGINAMQHVSVLHVAIANDRCDMLAELLQSTCPTSLDYRDSSHRTPALYAAELDSAECLQQLFEAGADFHQRNPDTGETLMHVVATHHSHSTLPFLIAMEHVSWFFGKKDYDGKTPYMSAIEVGNDTFLREAFKVYVPDFGDYNIGEGETFTYWTVRRGFPRVLMALLLSPRYYEYAKRDPAGGLGLNPTDPEAILRAEARGDIYATDVYILLRRVVEHPLMGWFPPNLLSKTKLNRNVFHGCALGGSLECLEFLYEFYHLFVPERLVEQFDERGLQGNNPCLMAALCGVASAPCVHFFVTHGADVSTTNIEGHNVLSAVFAYNCKATELIAGLMDSCVKSVKEHYYSDRTVKVDFSMLCPETKNQMTIACLMYDLVKDDEMRRDILQHPVLVAFVKSKVQKLNKWIYLRFLVLCLVTLSISFLVPQLFVVDGDPKERLGFTTYQILHSSFLMIVIAWITIALFKVNNLFSGRLWFTDIIAMVPPFALLPLVFYGKSLFFAPELSALAVLSSWMCVITFSMIFTSSFSRQVSVFFRLVNNISKQLVVLTAIIFAFSLSFFCVYHDNERFADIANSFIYVFIVMLHGMLTDLPTFQKEYYSKTPMTIHFIVECIVVALFAVIVAFAFTNMLIGLAVRGGIYLEADGKIYQNYYGSHIVNQIEYWCHSKFAKWVSEKLGLNIFQRLNDHLKVEMVFDISDEKNKGICDEDMIHAFRGIVLKNIERANVSRQESKDYNISEYNTGRQSNTRPSADVSSANVSEYQSIETA